MRFFPLLLLLLAASMISVPAAIALSGLTDLFLDIFCNRSFQSRRAYIILICSYWALATIIIFIAMFRSFFN